MSAPEPAADVIIVGGGPAGSTLGRYLSQAGVSNVILERANHPRPHVGESMVTATTRVFREIDFLDTMEREGFVKKFGASWHPTHKVAEFDIAFSEFPQEGVDQDHTYHVDRAKFDHLLLKHAEAAGSRVIQGVAATEVLFDEAGSACGVRASVAGEDVEIHGRMVADATGRDTLLGRQLRLKENDPIFNQFAVHAWYEGVNRGSGRTEDYIHIYFLPVERGWAWLIPITDTVTSIGVVAEREAFRDVKHGVEEYFAQAIVSNPSLEIAMRDATRVNEFKREGNYSYSMRRFCGDGFVLVGDACRFVDPIFSSGVSVAMHSAKFASEAIVPALAADDVSEQAFLAYEEKLKGGVTIWYEFIRLYYKLLPMFTRFIQDPEHRLSVLQLLQGDVYDRANAPVLDAMRDFVRTVEESDDHLLQSALTDVPI
ncbi:MAG: NAD(P)/FAD-dependent oxidoreductase [Longimicrobiales bacterium]